LQAASSVPMNTTTSGLKEIFDEFDEDKNGQISKEELKNGVH
jgi:Ca2+-binding EF-hand superfamily protein